jgi:hypothetical protein
LGEVLIINPSSNYLEQHHACRLHPKPHPNPVIPVLKEVVLKIN